jgi:hypothetical protein
MNPLNKTKILLYFLLRFFVIFNASFLSLEDMFTVLLGAKTVDARDDKYSALSGPGFKTHSLVT